MSTIDKPPRLVYMKNENGHFVCPHCGQVREKQNTMYYHMLTHNGKLPYECSICEKGFTQKQELTLHMQRRHPEKASEEKPVIYCPFPDCNFSDVRKGNVKTHCMRKHAHKYTKDNIDNTDGYHCNVCEFESRSAAGIYYHLSTCLIQNDVIPVNSSFMKLFKTL